VPLPDEDSRFLNVPVVKTVDGCDIYEIRTPLPYAPVAGTREIMVEANETLWEIAADEYGRPLWYWAVADFNDIHDVTTEVAAGQKLLIPPESYIREFLSVIIR